MILSGIYVKPKYYLPSCDCSCIRYQRQAAVRSVTEEAENKLADRDAQIRKLSVEVQEHKDARAQLVKEHAEQEVHMQTWLQSIPKFGRAK